MKLIFYVAVLLLGISCGNPGTSDKEIDTANAVAIAPKHMSKTKIGRNEIWNVDQAALKDGLHSLTLPNGNNLYAAVSSGKTTAVYITNRAGKTIRGITNIGSIGLEFTCGSWGCSCKGDTDCNDMFSTNVCGGYAVCFGEPPFCICSR